MTKNYPENQKDLIEKLKHSKEADLYFTAMLEECKKLDKEEANALLVEALQNLAKARPQDVNIDVNNENSFTMKALLRLLQFVAKKII